MALGPSRYDATAEAVLLLTGAHGVVLGIIGGNQGSGFAIKATADLHLQLPGILRQIADEIERDMELIKQWN